MTIEEQTEVQRLKRELAMAIDTIRDLRAKVAHLETALGLAQSGQRKAVTESK